MCHRNSYARVLEHWGNSAPPIQIQGPFLSRFTFLIFYQLSGSIFSIIVADINNTSILLITNDSAEYKQLREALKSDEKMELYEARGKLQGITVH